MNRKEKIEALKGIQQGTKTIADLSDGVQFWTSLDGEVWSNNKGRIMSTIELETYEKGNKGVIIWKEQKTYKNETQTKD